MKKVNLFQAIKAYRKSSGGRNLKLWVAQVQKSLKKTLGETERELDELIESLDEKTEEKNTELIDQLLDVDEDRMTTVSDREAYANGYLVSASTHIYAYKDDIQNLNSEIEDKKAEIANLKELQKSLTEIDLEGLIEDSEE